MKKVFLILVGGLMTLVASLGFATPLLAQSDGISVSNVSGKYRCMGRVEEYISLYSSRTGYHDASGCLGVESHSFRWELSNDYIKLYFKNDYGIENSINLLFSERNGKKYLDASNSGMTFVKVE